MIVVHHCCLRQLSSRQRKLDRPSWSSLQSLKTIKNVIIISLLKKLRTVRLGVDKRYFSIKTTWQLNNCCREQKIYLIVQPWTAKGLFINYTTQFWKISYPLSFLHNTILSWCLIHNAYLGKILSFCKILVLKITHLKKNFD
jgi:hypothetical protein